MTDEKKEYLSLNIRKAANGWVGLWGYRRGQEEKLYLDSKELLADQKTRLGIGK